MSTPLAIIAAMEQEAALLKSAMHQVTPYSIANMHFYHGLLDGQEVVLMQCGIGKVNAAIGTTLLLHHFRARAVINTGSAGALRQHLQVGDVVIGSAAMHHDVDVTAFGYEPGQMAQMPKLYPCDHALIEAAQRATDTLADVTVTSGLIVSGDQFIHGGARLASLRQLCPDALAVEMEAAAIAQVCYRFDTPCLIIRAISDNANGDADISFTSFLQIAAQQSAQIVRALLRHY